MLLSKAILEFSRLLEEHGDMELVTSDLDTGWVFKIEKENITFYKGTCEIYLKSYARAEEQSYIHQE